MLEADEQFGQEKTFWETINTSRWGSYLSDIENQAILKAHAFSKKTAAALDIGGDNGRWSKLLIDLGWSMIVTEVDDKTLAICKKKNPSANCILVKPEENKFPVESESINLLLCIEVFPVMQANWFTKEAFRVLQNDGLMVGVFQNLISFRGLYKHFTSNFDYYKYSYPHWRDELLRSGYSILYEEGYCWFPFSRGSNSEFVPYIVRLEKWLGLRKLVNFSPWIIFIAQKSSLGH